MKIFLWISLFGFVFLCALNIEAGKKSNGDLPPMAPKEHITKGTIDAFRAKWYSKHLIAMGEKPLTLEANKPGTCLYRLLWLRTFHHPILVRIEKTSAEIGDLSVKELDGAGGYAPGKLLKNSRRKLNKDELARYINVIKGSGFWDLPSDDENLAPGLDGAQWILEGYEAGKFHMVDRWSPTEGQYYKGYLECLRMSGAVEKNSEIY